MCIARAFFFLELRLEKKIIALLSEIASPGGVNNAIPSTCGDTRSFVGNYHIHYDR